MFDKPKVYYSYYCPDCYPAFELLPEDTRKPIRCDTVIWSLLDNTGKVIACSPQDLLYDSVYKL